MSLSAKEEIGLLEARIRFLKRQIDKDSLATKGLKNAYVVSYFNDPLNGISFHVEDVEDFNNHCYEDVLQIYNKRQNEIRYKAVGIFKTFESALEFSEKVERVILAGSNG